MSDLDLRRLQRSAGDPETAEAYALALARAEAPGLLVGSAEGGQAVRRGAGRPALGSLGARGGVQDLSAQHAGPHGPRPPADRARARRRVRAPEHERVERALELVAEAEQLLAAVEPGARAATWEAAARVALIDLRAALDLTRREAS